MKTSIFDFLNDISLLKKDILTDNNESDYSPYMINRFLSMNISTIMYANEMNINSNLPKRLQYDYYINAIKKQKRFFKYIKHKNEDNLLIIKEYFGYSNSVAKQVLPILSQDELDYMKIKLLKGGTKK
jgi:hypothetical protein